MGLVKLQDKTIFGMVAGVIAKFIMDIPLILLWKLKIVQHHLSHYAGSIIIDLHTLHHTWYGSVIGFLADYTYGALLGIIFIYLVTGARRVSKDQGFYLIKGLVYGAFLWLFSFGGLRSFEMVKLREITSEGALIYFPLHLLFGLALGWVVQRYERQLFLD